MSDGWHEECGVFGIHGHPEASNMTYLGLYALQHRGQESAGIASTDGEGIIFHKEMGLVADIFSEEILSRLPGHMAIGHVRYSTTGSSELKNAQPVVVDFESGSIAVAHNGNLVNAQEIRRELEVSGSIFQSSMDTEVIVHLIARSRKERIEDRIVDALNQVRGAYSLLFMTRDKLIGVRDPHGIRPLALGKLKGDGGTVICSESCALDLIEAQYLREVEPGEMIVVDERGVHSHRPFLPAVERFCIFEYVYFARPDSIMGGASIYEVRKALGRQLAMECPANADVVIPVPDSGVPAALGFSEASGIRFEMGLIRNHYVGRTFIEPQQSIRHFGVKIKLNAVRGVVSGKRVVVVDDSIVRGTTGRKIIKMIRAAGAKEVHLRISSPPTCYPCFYGIDTPLRRDLIAATHTQEESNTYLTSDSLGYLSMEGLHACVPNRQTTYCDACFSGRYPVPLETEEVGEQLPLFRGSVRV
ncbi:MAG TPA: amidophosphoribosyltransferase [Deltaproteobacteria bacterium]|nr:MAG: amidophosphoribosyltransferase [Deltaproteobacteria bacterium GWA2_65_63]OGP28180.1 MAG: amidophosphoribosyltransferase [Deltaproteobacteria bacterium GWB2_65_81]OGP36373.1 MAG: amidophosphoribosyltransferase [Deltaproteobacteria bacterium GWC2_66_88]OGP78028.1 MAG: amidophosphoribosyltransferase [Deltaproteobacteria bacterium RBG_16_66_15]HAM32627.1 amidophosphoribosyltransferase [Deltaproteobacteria bacterium]